MIAQSNVNLRDQIPIDLTKTRSYTYDNGTTLLTINLKNTGHVILGMDSIYLKGTGSWITTSFSPFNILPGQEKSVAIRASDYLDLDVNDEIGVIITANFDGSTKASDIAYLQTINDDPDLQILEYVDGTRTSFISANETGQLLVKNTGDEPIELTEIRLNSTSILSIDNNTVFEFGDKVLDIQECALISFNISDFNINATNTLSVEVMTNTTASDLIDLTAIVNSDTYSIEIDTSGTVARYLSNVNIEILNTGNLNVTLDAVYINGTLIQFNEIGDIIAVDSSLQLTISMTNLETIIGTVNPGEKLQILVRTREGAEDIHLETVIP